MQETGTGNNGYTKIGIYQNGVWYLDFNGNGAWDAGTIRCIISVPGWTSVLGDWNGERSDQDRYLPEWCLVLDFNGNGAWDPGTDKVYNFGAPGGHRLGDWNGAVGTKIGIYQNGIWYFDFNGNGAWDAGTDKVYTFGAPGWTSVLGDWNGERSDTEIGIYQNGVWYFDFNGNGMSGTPALTNWIISERSAGHRL